MVKVFSLLLSSQKHVVQRVKLIKIQSSKLPAPTNKTVPVLPGLCHQSHDQPPNCQTDWYNDLKIWNFKFFKPGSRVSNSFQSSGGAVLPGVILPEASVTYFTFTAGKQWFTFGGSLLHRPCSASKCTDLECTIV